uniref:Uncharacterized protein n=1 Tax=Chrysotila carterae TaxID=13221 RepID=A0A7S4FCL0_CHRCT|mmetsp:Transcript_13869/g.29867  ORF Transcript_13869/g.29867 Transcript_13869/m.29867 type:complete len:249 (+) Transcript_13869:15-761(+)|eukprot:3641756-Pleurochrysis_carterae.AAC.4
MMAGALLIRRNLQANRVVCAFASQSSITLCSSFAASTRCLSSATSDVVDATSKAAPPTTSKRADGLDVKVWGNNLELPKVTEQQARESYLDATSVTRAITPPTSLTRQAREDIGKERFNYVAEHMNPASQYVVMGKKGAVAPGAVSQSAILIASLLVLMSAITAGIYIKKEYKVNSMLELGDKLRERGAARRLAIENSGATSLARSFSQNADSTVKAHVDLVRRPTQQAGESLTATFNGGIGARKRVE